MHIRLRPVPPYDFGLSITLFEEGDPQIRAAENGRFWQPIRAGNRLVLSTLSAEGAPEQTVVHAKVQGPSPMPDRGVISRVLGEMLSLSLDLHPFYEAFARDSVLGPVLNRLRGLKPPRTPTLFEALVDSIIEQQISLVAAHHIRNRVVRKYGETVRVEGTLYYTYPRPSRMGRAEEEALRECGLSRQKARYIREIARAEVERSIDLESYRRWQSTEDVVEDLQTLRGVGRWTAELTVLRGLGRYEVFPADDLGMRRVFSRYYRSGSTMSGDEIRSLTEPWGRWRGLAAFYLMIDTWTGKTPPAGSGAA